jgi:hypothetical protein
VQVLLNILKAHAAAYKAMKNVPEAKDILIGLVHHHVEFMPTNPTFWWIRPLAWWGTFWWGRDTVLRFLQTGEFEWFVPLVGRSASYISLCSLLSVRVCLTGNILSTCTELNYCGQDNLLICFLSIHLSENEAIRGSQVLFQGCESDVCKQAAKISAGGSHRFCFVFCFHALSQSDLHCTPASWIQRSGKLRSGQCLAWLYAREGLARAIPLQIVCMWAEDMV